MNKFPIFPEPSETWEVYELPITDILSLRVVLSPRGVSSCWHITGPSGFKSIDLLSFAPPKTTVSYSPFDEWRMYGLKSGEFEIWYGSFSDAVHAIWILFHEIGHAWSHHTEKAKGKVNIKEERDAWAFSFHTLRKVSVLCGVSLLSPEKARVLREEMHALPWAESSKDKNYK